MRTTTLKGLLSALVFMTLCVVSAKAADGSSTRQASGKCGEDITWTLDEGVLTIEGTGKMYDYIYNSPWKGLSFTKAVIKDGITTIGDYVFSGCTRLTSVDIPSSVTSIGGSAFAWCTGLTNVDFPNSVTSIGESAFAWCTRLTSVTIPSSVTSIGKLAFFGCKGLTSADIPSSVTSIGDHAFSDCSGLTSVTIPNSVTIIRNYAFANYTGLTSVTIPNSVTSIGNYAFAWCTGLTSMDIPNSVTSIGNYAFAGCSGLTSVIIPNSVTSIGDRAFAYCTGLEKIESLAETPPVCDKRVFYNVNKKKCVLYVPKKSIDTYKSAEVWKDFKNIEALSGGTSSGKCGDSVTWTLDDYGVLTVPDKSINAVFPYKTGNEASSNRLSLYQN